MTTLRNTVTELATQFAWSVLDAIRGASLDDLLRETSGSAPVRRGRPAASAAAPTKAAAPAAAAPSRGRGRKSGGRLSRRSANDIAAIVDQIVGTLEANPDGLRAEQIREQLGLEAKELPRPLNDALSSGRVTKTGQKRATTYFAGGRASGSAKKGGKKGKKGRASLNGMAN